MLNNLYRKLHILFASSVMLIITLVIFFVVANTVHTEKINESTLFQRLTTLLIYQVESASSDMDKELKAYEESYHIFSLISDTKGNTIYQSDFPFPTSANNLLHDVEKQISTQPLSQTESNTTSQGGFLEIRGKHHDTYFVIPATIRTANDTVYHATFLYQTASLTDILQKTLPIYLLIWLLACIVVIMLTRYLLKKSFAPTERILQSQKDFVATASHELKSPLAVMISNTDMLLDNVSLNEQAKQAIQTIDFECMRLSRLVKDMLLLASSDAKTWTLHKSTINIDTLLITLYETYEPVCMKQNLELKLHLSEESYPAMFTDKDRLFQILCVFMDNAIQHSKNNS
ncbi:sensor histidine kinase, partial [Clostridioides difficile]|nr:sensor histidine kinase [Clostridioides difficile]